MSTNAKPSGADRLAEFRAGLDEREREDLEAQRRAALDALGARARSASVYDATRDALSRAEARVQRHLAVLQPEDAIACHAGCSSCCYMKVAATAPEILFVAEHLRQHASEGELERIQTRAARFSKDPQSRSQDTKIAARIPCPALTDAGACGVYAARPIVCRGWTSTDAESCERSLDDEDELPPIDMTLARACGALELGLVTALAESNLQSELIELTRGLDIALNEPLALERWLAGEPIFASALADD